MPSLYADLVDIVVTGMQDSDDEDLMNDIDQQIESMLAPKRTVKEIKAPASFGALGRKSARNHFMSSNPIQSILWLQSVTILIPKKKKFKSTCVVNLSNCDGFRGELIYV